MRQTHKSAVQRFPDWHYEFESLMHKLAMAQPSLLDKGGDVEAIRAEICDFVWQLVQDVQDDTLRHFAPHVIQDEDDAAVDAYFEQKGKLHK